MTDFQEIAIEEALRSELGKKADFWCYGRKHRTPMTFVLDEVERQIGPRFSVYWVDNGPPEIFCLPGFSPSPVVFSTRYLSLTAFIRHLFVTDWIKDLLVDVTKRTTLKLMSEMALRHGDPDYAVLAFVKSVTGKGIWLDDGDQLMTLEHEPIHEAYMATWFYGLVHELGHLHPTNKEDFSGNPVFSDDSVLAAITFAVNSFSAYPDNLKQTAIERAKQHRSTSVIGIDHIRKEGLADMFAASVLLKTTLDIMWENYQRGISQKRFQIIRFIQEMIIFLSIVTLIERCRQVATIASRTTSNYETQFECLVLPPVSIQVRGIMMRQYLDMAVATYLYDDETPSPEQLERAGKIIDDINDHYRDTIDKVDSGFAQAMEFSLFHERRENDWVILEEFRSELEEELHNSHFQRLEAQRFCDMAEALGASGKLLQALKGIIDDPRKPLCPDPKGDLVYHVPWVEGPNGFQCPFGLNTKHGHLVFVFIEQGELYNAFFKPSAEILANGYTLNRAIVLVPRKERLGPELAAKMPSDHPFQVVIEGTEEFLRYMQELADDTIWED